jgi:SAM-dependent methyltransferase
VSKNLFSQQSNAYAKYRPSYPTALIEYIISFTQSREMAWDVATGNGQAAVLLAKYFEKIFATDLSEQQLSLASLRSNIFYSRSAAEKTSFADNSFDLITVAQAYHWLAFETFEKEAIRVARPGAVMAVWGYNIPQSGIQSVDEAIRYFYKEVVGGYWDPERKYIEEAYQTIPFPMSPLPAKSFSIDVVWDLSDLVGYFQSWSSVRHFIASQTYNPVEKFLPVLTEAWPTEKKALAFSFPVFMRIGRVIK